MMAGASPGLGHDCARIIFDVRKMSSTSPAPYDGSSDVSALSSVHSTQS